MSAEELSVYDTPFSEVETRLVSWATEALDLRYGAAGDPKGRITLPEYVEGAGAFVDTLARVRIRLDRVSELRDKATQAKGRVSRAKAQAEFEAQRAFDEAMQRRGATRQGSYTTAAEKNADAALDSFVQKRLAHQAERLVSVASEAKTVIDNAYWGLSSIREELLTLYKNLTLVTYGMEVTSEHADSGIH